MKKMNKKGQVFENFKSLAVGIASLTLVLTIAFLILTQGKTQIVSIEGSSFCTEGLFFNQSNTLCVNVTNTSGLSFTPNTSAAYNSTMTMQNATQGIPGWESSKLSA